MIIFCNIVWILILVMCSTTAHEQALQTIRTLDDSYDGLFVAAVPFIAGIQNRSFDQASIYR